VDAGCSEEKQLKETTTLGVGGALRLARLGAGASEATKRNYNTVNAVVFAQSAETASKQLKETTRSAGRKHSTPL